MDNSIKLLDKEPTPVVGESYLPSVFLIRAVKKNSGEEGFRPLAIAEVKWSRPISVEGEACDSTGLKYVMI